MEISSSLGASSSSFSSACYLCIDYYNLWEFPNVALVNAYQRINDDAILILCFGAAERPRKKTLFLEAQSDSI
jgi:hypothetical protein